jgi:hypothetical protein
VILHDDIGKACGACGHLTTDLDPPVRTTHGYRVHRSHTATPNSGLYGTAVPDETTIRTPIDAI